MTPTRLCYQGSLRLKNHSHYCLSPCERSNCLSGRFFRISKCIPLTSGPFWRRKWQPTSVFLPVKSHGQRSLVGYSPWSPKKLDLTERLDTHLWSMSFFNVVLLNCFSGEMSLQVSPLRVCFLSLNFYSFPGNIPQWFSNASILGLSFPCKIEGVGCPMWSSNLLLLRENSYTFVIPPSWGSLQLGCVFCLGFVFFFFPLGVNICLFLLPASRRSFNPLLLKTDHQVFRSLSEGSIPYAVVGLLCPWEEMNLGSFFTTVLNLLQFSLLIHLYCRLKNSLRDNHVR